MRKEVKYRKEDDSKPCKSEEVHKRNEKFKNATMTKLSEPNVTAP